MNPKYPIYIISKGRWNNSLTAKALDKMGVPYVVCVEPQEADKYAQTVGRNKLRILPFSNLGQGSIPARNWVWDDAVKAGVKRYWIMDDNMSEFYRLNKNRRIRVDSGTILKASEDFVDRYENVAMAGLQYYMFAPDDKDWPAFYLNTRVYSCILLKTDIPFRWRGRYNEDTDLSIRIMKAGLCTILLTAFLVRKMPTLTMKGGNTDELYAGDGRLRMAQSLQEQHPDIVTTTRKWGRWQHLVDYRKFKANKLIRRKDIFIKPGIDNYGMRLKNIITGEYLQ